MKVNWRVEAGLWAAGFTNLNENGLVNGCPALINLHPITMNEEGSKIMELNTSPIKRESLLDL